MKDVNETIRYLREKSVLQFSLLFLSVIMIQLIYMPALMATNLISPREKLQLIQSKLKLLHGNFNEEYDEQLMIAMYIPQNAKVLEIGGNVGRTACVIASILNNSNNFVTIEPIEEYAKLLQENQKFNGLQFHIEVCAISKVPLVQSGWVSIPSEVDLPGFKRLKTTTFDDLQKKYKIEFDTLVIDCEGAFYYILRDDPTLLRNINLVIIENDFDKLENLQYVHNLFREYGFYLVYNKDGFDNPASYSYPGYKWFHQVWKR